MRTFKKIILFSIILLLTVSCKKETLTKATQIGANTLSSKINDKVYIAKTDLFSPKFTGGVYSNYINSTSSISLFARIGSVSGSSKQEYSLNIEFPLINRTGIYILSNRNFFEVVALPYTIGGETFTTKFSNDGTLTVTFFDYQNKIISGTFLFIGKNKDNLQEQISVTDGRFDIKGN